MKERKITDIFAVCIIVMFILVIIFSHRLMLEPVRDISEFNTGWTISYEESRESVILPASVEVPAGTTITLTNTIPETPLVDSGLLFRTRVQSAEVYLDGRKIYAYPEEDLLGDVLPSSWNFVRLPDDCGGQTIEIRLESPYSGFSGNLPEVYIGNYNDLITMTVRHYSGSFLLSLFPGVIGAVVVFLSVVFAEYGIYGYQRTFGFLFMFISFWLCGESMMPLPWLGLEAQYFITMGSLPLCPVFLLAFQLERWNSHARIMRGFLYISIVWAGLSILFQMTGIYDFPETLPVSHGILAAALIYTALFYIEMSRAGKADKSELACTLLIAVAGIIELILFYSRHSIVGIYVRIGVLVFALNFLRLCIVSINDRLKENRELQRQLEFSRLELMNSQIKPHFIYNSLNSIRTLIRMDPDAAYDAVYDFSTYLRANLNTLKDDDLILFADELKNIRAYLNIEKLRLGRRLHMQFRIEETEFLIPHLCIQPLVENAVKHGIWKKKGEGTVWIREYETKASHVIEITDDGVGFDTAELEQDPSEASGHIGIQNIRFRIAELTGGKFEICSEAGRGTRVTIEFPRSPIEKGRRTSV